MYTDNYRQIILRASEGDEHAFAQLFYEYSSALLPFARKLSSSSVEAEEIIQNVFLRVWLHRDKLTEIENLKSWLYKFVVNESLTYIRKKTVKDKADRHFQNNVSPFGENTEDTVNFSELKAIIAQAVAQMPEQRKKIFHLSRTEGLTIKEISEHLNISQSTVKNTLVIALKFIRSYLNNYGYSSFAFIALIMN